MSCMQLDVENAIKVILACCVLHKFLCDKERDTHKLAPPNFFMSPEGEVFWQGQGKVVWYT